jgi:hypothetical protein
VFLQLQDMPGWGDDINLVNSLKTVLDFLLKQRQKDYIKNKAGLIGEVGSYWTMKSLRMIPERLVGVMSHQTSALLVCICRQREPWLLCIQHDWTAATIARFLQADVDNCC